MKKKVLLAALAGASVLTIVAKDPTLMVIDGKKVPLSEFQYLYNKNNSQQAQKQSIGEYVDMFVTYKLKVADAEAAGIDKTPTFQKEFEGYRNELARPHLRDTVLYNKMLQEAYERKKEEVLVSHVMLPRGENPDLDKKYELRLDSIRTAILNGSDFEENVMKYSIDGSKQRNRGSQGYVIAGRFPYEFEEASFNTKIGEISPVFKTEFGHHIVKVFDRRPTKGEVLVQHLLLLTAGKDSIQAAAVKGRIDSVYTALKNGADFDELAKSLSEDPGTKRNGGRLDWFGVGRMVPEFEKTSYELKDGEISEPFKTSYGYHIVKKLDSRGVPSFEDSKNEIIGLFTRDGRINLPEKAKIVSLKKEYNASIDEKAFDKLIAEVNKHGKLDTIFVDNNLNNKKVIATVGKRKITIGEVMNNVNVPAAINAESAPVVLKSKVNECLNNATLDLAREDMLVNNTEYRNLVNEYRDGMLLFEISNQKVWDKASKDKEGLEKYFQTNCSKYTWDKPRFKGYVVFTPNDSTEVAVKDYIAKNNINADSISAVLRNQFGKDVKVERVIAAEKDNAIIDAIAFGAKRPEITGRWTNYFPFQGKIIYGPEEAADVRGAVTTDYQNELEKAWVEELKAKYKVKINQGELEKLK